MSTITSIYSKRINSSALVLVHYNGTLVRVLLNAGKRVEFSDWKSAKAKAWHIQQAGVMGFEWSRYMTRKEFDARIAQLLEQSVEIAENDNSDNAELDAQYRDWQRKNEEWGTSKREQFLKSQDETFEDDSDDEYCQAELAL